MEESSTSDTSTPEQDVTPREMEESATRRNSSPMEDVTLSGKTRSIKDKFLISLTLLLLVTTIIFLCLFSYYYVKFGEIKSTELEICTTLDCMMTAAMMIKKMNLTADPCKDFNEYACGQFNKGTITPEGVPLKDSFSSLRNENDLILQDIVMQDIKHDEPRYLQTMKRFFRSCIDEAKIEEIGLAPFLKETEFVRDWPTLSEDWDDNTFNLNDVIARYASVYTEELFDFRIKKDLDNTSRVVLYLTEPSLGLSKSTFSRQRNDSSIMAYQTFLAEFAIVLGANRSVAEQDAKEVIDLKIALSEILDPASSEDERTEHYNPVTLKQLSSMYPVIDIPRALRSGFATANINLPDDEKVINSSPAYYGNLSRVIKSVSNRALQNLFGFSYAMRSVGSLTKRLREIQFNFDTIARISAEDTPRVQSCMSTASRIFWRGFAKQYVARTFSEEAGIYIEGMIDNLKTTFRQMIEERPWMEQTTKDAAKKKLAAMKSMIGYPNENFTEADIDKEYEKLTMLDDNYYANNILIAKFQRLRYLTSLRKPEDKTEWSIAPFAVNAKYQLPSNALVLPAGYLRAPTFSTTFQDSMNYGAIGVIIGHEITHGFDDQGSQFDEKGQQVDWWQKKDRYIYKKTTRCMMNQYSNFYIEEIKMNVDGVQTIDESVADNGGLKESYRAYKAHVRKNGERPTLPALGLTQDQLFFLAFAQLWCSKVDIRTLLIEVIFETYPPEKYRIIGALQNSQGFANAYNCPSGSYMNPRIKCEVW